MPSIAFAAPILPGKTEQLRQAALSHESGDRKEAYEASRQPHGITREMSWIQPSPMGDLSVVLIEADDLDAAFAGLGTSQDPFDVWFREQTREIHGINIEDGFPPPEQLMDTGPPRRSHSAGRDWSRSALHHLDGGVCGAAVHVAGVRCVPISPIRP